MRIGIDARMVYYRQAGIAQYVVRLIEALAQINCQDEFILLQSRKDRLNITEQPNFTRRSLWTPCHHRLEQWTLPLEFWPLGLDVLHSPDFIPPMRSSIPSLITVHDLAFLRFPHFLTEESARYYGQIDHAVVSADHIVAVSESTKRDIVELLGVPPGKITVIYEAANPIYRPIENPLDLVPVREKYGLPESYILFVSTVEPRKNLPTLLRAFRLLTNEYIDDIALAVVGQKGWLFDQVFRLVDELDLQEQVRFLGRVPLHDLPYLYNGATVHVHPSFYEGFGLTPLEAMACATPTIVSNVSSLPEVVGDAGLIVEPTDVEALAMAIWKVISQPDLRDELRAKGLKRAALFSWQKAAQYHLELYQRLGRSAQS
jgi:glycosyltransferase involved in cell wall biosynthesis